MKSRNSRGKARVETLVTATGQNLSQNGIKIELQARLTAMRFNKRHNKNNGNFASIYGRGSVLIIRRVKANREEHIPAK